MVVSPTLLLCAAPARDLPRCASGGDRPGVFGSRAHLSRAHLSLTAIISATDIDYAEFALNLSAHVEVDARCLPTVLTGAMLPAFNC